MRRWEEIFTEVDRMVLQKTGLGKRREYGKNPALLIVDIKMNMMGSSRKPILEAVEECVTSCGEAGWDSLPYAERLLEACRANGIPVIHVTADPDVRRFTSASIKGFGPGEMADPKLEEIPPSLTPLPSELIIRKTKASAFWETPLASCIRDMGIDSLLVAGATTSGCVRATVIDAHNHGFRCFVVEECVFDRFELSHLVNLWDLNFKYADVITVDEVLKYVAEIGHSREAAVTD